MIRQKMVTQLAILFLLLGTSMAWSKRMHKPGSTHAAHDSEIAAAESKVKPRYSQDPKTAESYMVDDVYPKDPGHSDGYLDSEEHKSVHEQDEAQGNEDSDHTVKNDEVDDYSEKGGRRGSQAGGSSFDKHLKDHKADNKEIENVKEHDASEKFGGEATKEHKLGKHKEKSKGHKLHGFKNVYHKEEYGDHKTFHDEFLDSDHQHNYDDHHEHQEMQGGKFSKGYKHEGKNDKHDKGDEKHEWGKEDFDGHHEGIYEKGRQKSKHRHATKKHQGHYDANAQRQKNAVRKVKKGVPPPPSPPYVPHEGHHGPHQAQIEPYVSQYNSHHGQLDVPSHSYIPLTNKQSHQIQFDDDKSISNDDHGSQYRSHDSHHNGHRGHHHEHGGHRDSDVSDEYFPKDDSLDNDFQDRTARNHDHRSLLKDSLEDKSDEKFAPIIKHEPVTRKHEPIVHKNEAIVRTHEPILHKHVPIVHKHEPIVRTHESIGHKHEPHAHKHHPHSHQYHSHGHKQSISPNFGIQQYRQPVFQENSQSRPSLSSKPEKFSDPFNEKLHNHNHRIRYGHQPRNHQRQHNHHHNRNPRINHNFNPHRRHPQPFPRFSGFNHHRSIHPTYEHHHHHHSPHKNHSQFRYTPSTYQPEPKPEIQSPTPEYTSSKPTTDESQYRNSHKHYE